MMAAGSRRMRRAYVPSQDDAHNPKRWERPQRRAITMAIEARIVQTFFECSCRPKPASSSNLTPATLQSTHHLETVRSTPGP